MKILVSFYRLDGSYRGGGEVDIGYTKITDRGELIRTIVRNQDILKLNKKDIKVGGWQGRYYVVTDRINRRLEYFRGFHSHLFQPEEFEGVV